MELVFWDEAPMQSKYDVEAVNRLFQELFDNESPFGGKVFCFCGDFRQTLPVVPGATPEELLTPASKKRPFGRTLSFSISLKTCV